MESLPGGSSEAAKEEQQLLFRDLTIRAATELYSASCVEDCIAFGDPSDCGTPALRAPSPKGKACRDSAPRPCLPNSRAPPPETIMDFARLCLDQSFRCCDLGTGASPPPRRPRGAPLSGKRSRRRRMRLLLPICSRLSFDSGDGVLTAHPFRREASTGGGAPPLPRAGGSRKRGFAPGKEGAPPPRKRARKTTPTVELQKRAAESSVALGPNPVKLKPASRSLAVALYHSWTVLYYPGSVVLGAAGVCSIDELDSVTSPHFQHWLASLKFLGHQISEVYERGGK